MAGIAEVEETGRSMLVLKDISLEPPHLSIEVRCQMEARMGTGVLDPTTLGLWVQQPQYPCLRRQSDDESTAFGLFCALCKEQGGA